MEEELRKLIDDWRASAETFQRNQRLMETGPEHLHAEAKIQLGWKEALRSCANKLEEAIASCKSQA